MSNDVKRTLYTRKEEKEKKKRSSYEDNLLKSTKISDKNTSQFVDVILTDLEGNQKFDAQAGDVVIVKRFESSIPGKYEFNQGKIHSIEEDGTIKWFDDCRGQWFYFNWKVNPPRVLRRLLTTQKPTKQIKEVIKQKLILTELLNCFIFDPPATVLFTTTSELCKGTLEELCLPISGSTTHEMLSDAARKIDAMLNKYSNSIDQNDSFIKDALQFVKRIK